MEVGGNNVIGLNVGYTLSIGRTEYRAKSYWLQIFGKKMATLADFDPIWSKTPGDLNRCNLSKIPPPVSYFF